MLKFIVVKKPDMNLLKHLKGNKLYSIFTGTCPVCQEESMYVEPNPYKISSLFDMHSHCSNCHTKYKMEPSFFFGAMYVSYGLGVGLGIIVFLLAHYAFGLSRFDSFLAITVAILVTIPINARLSRNIWINFFLDYDEKYQKS